MSTDRARQIKERISYLNMEIIHEGYHDGYTLQAFKTELDKLNKELQTIENRHDSKCTCRFCMSEIIK